MLRHSYETGLVYRLSKLYWELIYIYVSVLILRLWQQIFGSWPGIWANTCWYSGHWSKFIQIKRHFDCHHFSLKNWWTGSYWHTRIFNVFTSSSSSIALEFVCIAYTTILKLRGNPSELFHTSRESRTVFRVSLNSYFVRRVENY